MQNLYSRKCILRYRPRNGSHFVGGGGGERVKEQLHTSSNRKFHSSETALTCVHDHDDILRAIDDNKSVLLIMLDLSAAFDTVDHDVLLERLKSGLGICGTALNSFKSYLPGRSQSFLINGTQSKPTSLVCGVPQGSVLGPILCCLWVT